MKGIAAFFFISLFPVVVFIFSILYGGITPQILKDGLTKADIYEKLPDQFSKLTKSEEFETEEPDTFIAPILARMEGPYLQEKVETLIDDVDLWIRTNDAPSPKLSLSEIKEDILAANPDHSQMMNDGIAEMQTDPEMQSESGEQIRQMQEFLQNDFSFELGQHLKPLKDFYTVLSFLLPILGVLLLLSFGAIILLAKDTKSRLKWGGIVLILASMNGFVSVLGGDALVALLVRFITTVDHEIVAIIRPAITHIATLFVEQYKSHQLLASSALLTTGIALLVVRFVINKNQSKSVKSKKK